MHLCLTLMHTIIVEVNILDLVEHYYKVFQTDTPANFKHVYKCSWNFNSLNFYIFHNYTKQIADVPTSNIQIYGFEFGIA